MERTRRSALTASIAVFVLLLCGSSNVNSQTQNGVGNTDVELGLKFYREGNYPDAITSLKKAVKVNRNDADAWYYLGLSWLKVSELKNATKAFEKACKLQPNSARAQSGFAYSLLLRHKVLDGLRESERAVALDDNNAEALFVLGVAYLHTGDRERALNQADRAIQIKQNFADAYLLKSQTLVQFTSGALVQPLLPPEERTNRYQDAASALETYLQLAPASVERQLWSAQLEALNFHLGARSKALREQNNIYSSKEVTTKARILSKPEPQYTPAARSNQVTGTVVLRALFASDGTVKHIVVIYGLPDGLTWQSVRAAENEVRACHS